MQVNKVHNNCPDTTAALSLRNPSIDKISNSWRHQTDQHLADWLEPQPQTQQTHSLCLVRPSCRALKKLTSFQDCAWDKPFEELAGAREELCFVSIPFWPVLPKNNILAALWTPCQLFVDRFEPK
jgi:hypothetical protein